MSIDDVRSLVAERQQYDDWLAALDARRAETPARVFDRVHADYASRRAGVMERLNAHVGPLSALGEDLDHRLQELENRLAGLEDERAEAMLRTAVGEFDSARWDAVREDVEGQIAALGGERVGLLAEVDEVRTLLSSARTEVEAVVEPEPEPALAEHTSVTETEPGLSEGAAPAAEHELLDLNATQSNLDAIADTGVETEQVADAATDEAEAADSTHVLPTSYRDAVEMHVVADVNAAATAAQNREVDDALSMFTDGTPAPDAHFVRSLDGIQVEVDEPTLPSAGAGASAPYGEPEPTTATATPPSMPADPFDDLAFLRSVTATPGGPIPPIASAPSGGATSTEPQKTLRCTECGTMNLPTEWYCERCGGELAAF